MWKKKRMTAGEDNTKKSLEILLTNSQQKLHNIQTFSTYNAALQSVLDKHAPVSKHKVSLGKYSPRFSLVGDQLLTAKRHRRQAEQ